MTLLPIDENKLEHFVFMLAYAYQNSHILSLETPLIIEKLEKDISDENSQLFGCFLRSPCNQMQYLHLINQIVFDMPDRIYVFSLEYSVYAIDLILTHLKYEKENCADA